MLAFFKKKSNKIIVAVFMLAAMLFYAIPAKAETLVNTTLGTYGFTNANEFRLSYGKTDALRSTARATDETVQGNFIHEFTIEIPLTIYWYNNCYINGFFKWNTTINFTTGGTGLYSMTRSCEFEYIPYNTDDGTFYSSAYCQTNGTNGYYINIHTVAANFDAHAGALYTFGMLRFHFVLSSPLDELTQISDEITLREATGDMNLYWEYDPNAGISGAIVNALEYEFDNGSYSDFMESVITYLYGLDQNAYDQTQLLSDLYTANQSIISLVSYSNTYLSSIMNNVITFKSNFDSYTSTQTTRWLRLFDMLEQLISGSTDTEAQSELDDAGQQLESAGAQMSVAAPNISSQLQQVQNILGDQDTVAAQGNLFAWINTGWIITLLVICCGLAIFRFVLFGKR